MTTSPGAPATPASGGHDHVEDAEFVARVQALRARDRVRVRRALRFGPAVGVVVALALFVAMMMPHYVRWNCRTWEAEGRSALLALRTVERSFFAEHDRFTLDPEEMGWTVRAGPKRYAYFLRADKETFEAVALGVAPPVEGDVWRIGDTGEIEHLADGCR
jgi:hypothetical protein